MYCLLSWLFILSVVNCFHDPEITSEIPIQRDNIIGEYVEILEGEEIKLTCTHPTNEEVEFLFPNLTDFKAFDPVDFSLRKEEREESLGNALIIRNAKSSDTGTYTCAVKDQPSIAHHVHVFVKGDEVFVPVAVSGFSVDPAEYVVPCKASKNIAREVQLKVNGDDWKNANKYYDPRIGFKFNEKTAENKLTSQIIYSCIYPKTGQNMQFFISPKSNVNNENLQLEWGEMTDWAYIGGEFALECNLKFPDQKSLQEKHKHYIKITCPRCVDTTAVTTHNRPRQRGISQYIAIKNLTAEDRGNYVCTWYFEKEEHQNITRDVEISNKKGQFKVHGLSERRIIVNSGGKFDLMANFTVYPNLQAFSAKWIRTYSIPLKGEEIAESVLTDAIRSQDSVKKDNDVFESLSVKNATLDMSGLYVLTLEVLETRKTIEFNVTVLSKRVKASIEISTNESYVIFDQKYYPPGKQLFVLCHADSLPLASVALMYKKASSLDGWLDVDPDQLTYDNGTFRSSLQWDTTLESSIDVRCIGKSDDLSTDYDEKRIRVSDGQPSVASSVIKSQEANENEDAKAIYEGDTVILNCTFPQDGEWSSRWAFEGVDMQNTVITNGSISQMNIATIKNISAAAAGEYTCILINNERPKILKLIINVIKTMKPYHTQSDPDSTLLHYGENATLTCHLSGIPKPKIAWFKDKKEYTSGYLTDDNRTLHIDRVALEDQGKFYCQAQNRAGVAESLIITKVKGGPAKTSSIWMTIMFLIVICLLCCVCAFVYVILKQRRTNKEQNRALEVLYEQLMRETSVSPPIGPKQPIDQRVGDLPYNREFELDKDSLHFENRIGTGQFGQVWKGSVSVSRVSDAAHEDKMFPVAIKGPLNGRNPTHQKMLADELKIMCAIGRHPNVLTLVGAVTKNMKSGELFVVVELCENGNLKEYLLQRKAHFIDELRTVDLKDDGYVAPNSAHRTRYACELNAQWSEDAEKERLLPDSATLTTSDLLSFALQVANGMEYLSSIPCIHRDLAARNILLTSDGICRIADFGMARNENKDYYKIRKSKNVPVPYRWMSIEAIEEGLFTSESDVWSYGILLYEIFTLSGLPYPTTSNEELLDKLKAGHRNSKPSHCHEEIYDLMSRCWSEIPSNRPSFSECVHLFKSHLNLSSPQLLERIETAIVKEVTKQNNISRWLRPEEDYREQARNGLSLQNGASASENEHVYLSSFQSS